jgi:hypothetical protein
MMSRVLFDSLTHPQAIMGMDVDALHAAADQIAAGAALTSAQTSAIEAAHHVLGGPGSLTAASRLPSADRAQMSAAVTALGDAAAIGQRTLITAAVTSALEDGGWTVTVVDGGDADRYSGIEATRDTEHLVAAAGAGELITDQSGARDCGGTVAVLTAALRRIGLVTIANDIPHAGAGGTLYALDGGPTRAHAVQASLRPERSANRADRRLRAPAATRLTTGQR